MSGLEIPALVATVIGTGAGAISAYKALKERGSSVEAIERTWNDGKTITTEKIICASTGLAASGVNANGDVYARSSPGGSALAVHHVRGLPAPRDQGTPP